MTDYTLSENDIDRFWTKVDKTASCWLWTAALTGSGYGQFFVEPRKMRVAHRVAYELLVGPIPEGMQLDHLCRVRECVNPNHVEPVTCRENLMRGDTLAAANARKTHCYKGHLFDEDNTGSHKGARYCRTCYRATQRRLSAAKRLVAA